MTTQTTGDLFNDELRRMLASVAASASHRIRQQEAEIARLEKENKGLRATEEGLQIKIYELRGGKFSPPSAAFQNDTTEGSFPNEEGQDNG